MTTCEIDGCPRPRVTGANPLCDMHYRRKREGRPFPGELLLIGPDGYPTADVYRARLLERIEIDENECWNYTGFRHANGYGIFSYRGRYSAAAHRVAVELFVGPFDPALHVCHRCDNPPCINPDHLFLGTHEDNMRDMARKGRAAAVNRGITECRRGHPFDEANTIWRPDGRRKCRTCFNASNIRTRRARNAARKAVA